MAIWLQSQSKITTCTPLLCIALFLQLFFETLKIVFKTTNHRARLHLEHTKVSILTEPKQTTTTLLEVFINRAYLNAFTCRYL